MTKTSTSRGRVVAIVGRPNVGKSALFNRIVGRGLAIVHSQSGVTRDRLVCEAEWFDQRFDVVDTGGIGDVRRSSNADVIEAGIRSQADAALEDAAVVIFVVDITAGITPLDEEVAAILRASDVPIITAANKADGPEKDDDCSEFDRFGFPVMPVSALNKRGIDELVTAACEHLPAVQNETHEKPLRIAIVGRPNVGKSSYINRLLRADRVIVSDIAGTTRDSIEIPFVVGQGEGARHYTLIDTAGMRRKGKIDTAVERFSLSRAAQSIKKADVVVQVLDATAGPTTQDKKIASLIHEHERGHLILVNKWDLSEDTQRQYGPEMARSLPYLNYIPIVYVSAQSGYNIRKSIDAIDYVASMISTELPTGVLNRTIMDAYEKVQPPHVQGRRLKIFYAVQTGTAPITVTLFVNHPSRMKDTYERYLVSRLREVFGLEGAPVRLKLRARRGEDKDIS
jgi:GTP-binding protein